MAKFTAEQQLAAWESTSIINTMNALSNNKDREELRDLATRMHLPKKRYKGTCVDRVRSVLGKQSYCWNGSQRYWVWEIGDEVRIFVSPVTGISFEVNEKLRAEDQLARLRVFVAILEA